ncbi:acyltransferase [Arthrobacter mangrovi]|uniref:Acyltransferase n=1 Tax=Arthrobacter mangrovi TaxID=2966350 RepID=A0ABQ5MVE8_9MICC|nr:acyltransferase [Arthrobacter mangrovi]
MAKPRPDAGQKKNVFRPDIQGLRAFAVLAVIADHLFHWPAGGFVGVDVFFVISGFLITGLLIREHEKTGTISFTNFYKRRVKRILPASVLVLLVTAAAAWLVFPANRARETTVDALWSFFFAGNWRFATEGTDYFQEGMLPSPLQHYWSLGVEEQFYFVWPWVMLLVYWLLARRGLTSARVILGWIMGGIILASFGWAVFETTTSPTWAYFSTFSRAWELGIGALLAVASPILSRIQGSLRPVLGWLGLAGMFASLFLITAGPEFPAPAAAFPVLCTALVIASGSGQPAQGMFALTNRAAGYIGDISFSLYLWHWPIIIILVAFLPSDSALYYGVALGLTAALSVASYHFVENPLRHFELASTKRQRRRQVSTRTANIALGALAVMTAACVTFALNDPRHVVDQADAQTGPSSFEQLAAERAAEEKAHQTCFGAASTQTDADCAGLLDDSLTPSIDDYADDNGSGYECWRGEGEEFQDCTIGSAKDDAMRIAVIGDSHAASMLPAISEKALANNWSIDVFVGWGCQWKKHADTDDCRSELEKVQEKLLAKDAYNAVITTAKRRDPGQEADSASAGFAEVWEPVAERGTKVIAIADVPAVSQRALECLTRVGFNVKDNDCATPKDEALAGTDPLIAAVETVSGAALIETTDYFCDLSSCPVVIGNAIAYRDSAAHITGTYAKTLAPFLEQDLKAALKG